MSYKLNKKILEAISSQHEELVDLIKTLCKIPAPLNGEKQRAEFCKQWLEKCGAKGVYIDAVYNVIYQLNCDDNNDVSVFMAHTDTVFPATTQLLLKEADGKLYCPGVGDDTSNLALLMMSIKYIIKNNLQPDRGCVFVCDSGEEGLGNLKGVRAIMDAFGKRVKALYSFDGTSEKLVNCAVGSVRYKVEIKTEGGHSFSKFGNKNAIAYLAALITDLYKVKVPEQGRTTYNVGTIAGGTSINSIAQQAEMLFEYRSNVREHLEEMMVNFDKIIDSYRAKGVEINMKIIGKRACMGNVDKVAMQEISTKVADIFETYTSHRLSGSSSSRDSNIPLSMGIPAVSFGGYKGHGNHTKEEWIELASLKTGFPLILTTILDEFRANNADLFE